MTTPGERRVAAPLVRFGVIVWAVLVGFIGGALVATQLGGLCR